MNFINETLKRSTVQALREYLLYGIEDTESYTPKSYNTRLRNAYQRLSETVRKYEPDNEDSLLNQIINQVITEYEHVYMELGIQAGFQLARELERCDDEEQLSTKYKAMYSSLFQDITKTIDDLQKSLQNAEELYISD